MTPHDFAEHGKLIAALGPAPWMWERDGIYYGYVDAGGEPTVLFGENCEGAVSEGNPEGIALAALRNSIDAYRECVRCLVAVVAIADRETVEFQRARAALSAFRNVGGGS